MYMHAHRKQATDPDSIKNRSELDCTQGVLLPWLITTKTRVPVCDRQHKAQERQNQCQWESTRGILQLTKKGSLSECRQPTLYRASLGNWFEKCCQSFDGKESAEVSVKISWPLLSAMISLESRRKKMDVSFWEIAHIDSFKASCWGCRKIFYFWSGSREKCILSSERGHLHNPRYSQHMDVYIYI